MGGLGGEKHKTMTEKDNEAEFNEHKDYNSFAKPTIHRGYTDDLVRASLGDIPAEELDQPIPEATYTKPIFDEEDKPKSKTKSSSDDLSYSDDVKTPLNPPLEDLNPAQKRKAANIQADAFLNSYQRLFPVPFKYIASYDINKMKKLHNKGEININTAVKQDGTTILDYTVEFNDKIDKTLVVSDEMKEELKDPVVELIMEQGIALTPFQQILMIVGTHAISFLQPTLQLAFEKRNDMEQFRQFKKEDDAKGLYSSNRPTQYAQPYQQQAPQYQQQPEYQQQAPEPPQPTPSMVVVQNEPEEATYQQPNAEELIEPTYSKPSLDDMDDYINDTKKTGTTE